MSNFGKFYGQEFLDLKIPPREWLVDKLIKEGDSVILVGNEKSGKSLFIFQLICSLTTTHLFLDTYETPKPRRVVYLQLEGELGDSQERMVRMSKSIDLDPSLLHFFFSAPLELQNEDYMKKLAFEIIEHCNPKASRKDEVSIKPDVLIIDPIYFAFTGSLSKDEIVRQFLGNIRKLKDYLGNCAIILVHHTHKTRWDYKGNVIDEGDEALFGSKFLKAWADHILMFMFDQKTGKRTLLCNTQRSGNILKECNLTLVEPNPLYFKKDDVATDKDLFVVNLLQKPEYKDGLCAKEIALALGISETHFYNSIKKPLAEDMVIKLNERRPVRYVFNYEKFGSK